MEGWLDFTLSNDGVSLASVAVPHCFVVVVAVDLVVVGVSEAVSVLHRFRCPVAAAPLVVVGVSVAVSVLPRFCCLVAAAPLVVVGVVPLGFFCPAVARVLVLGCCVDLRLPV